MNNLISRNPESVSPSASVSASPSARVPRLDALSFLPDDLLLARVRELASLERSTTTDLVAHLAEVELRRLYLGRGCSSMFAYCTEVLGLAEGAAYVRIEVSRAVRRVPMLLDCLAEGSLSMTTIRRLSPILNPENCDRLIAEARGKSSRAVEEFVARERPKADVPSTIRLLPETKRRVEEHAAELVARRVARGEPQTAGGPGDATNPSRACGHTPAVRHTDDRDRPSIRVTAPERYRVQFTAAAEMRERIQRLQDLLRHRIPDGDLAAVIDLALIELLAKVEKRKFGAGTKREAGEDRSADPAMAASKTAAFSSASRTTTRRTTRSIPSAIRGAVWRRDTGRCRFVSDDARACSATGFLQFHHVEPFARGGGATEANLHLRCRAHNAHEAELVGLGRHGP